MPGCCGCCQTLRPRYKRLVDNIYPDNPDVGLVKSNMDKLTFFAMKSPEKLDRIGDYLAQRLSHDIDRTKHRYSNAAIAMEALDILLITCHAQTLNIFVDSYLKMVQKLLETGEPDLQILGTNSFVKFANIKEDTPSYHRCYDFFITKFSTMCYSTYIVQETRSGIRIAGLNGLQGVVRKTVADDLQANIWHESHMEKIVPALLFNVYEGMNMTDLLEGDPAVVAENVFRDLVCRASYGNVSAVIKPLLTHLDKNKLWVPNRFAIKCFKCVMYSVQAQYGYMVVQMLMAHLDHNSKQRPEIRSAMIEVLSEAVLIAAGGSIGPSVLEVFNTLLRHLRVSVATVEESKTEEEKIFQEAIVNTIGEFAKQLPDYQKIEILMFVMGKIPTKIDKQQSAQEMKDSHLQHILMKTILTVATKYQATLIVNAFPSALLEPLLRLSLVRDANVRLLVQQILQTLIDRHENLPKLVTVGVMTAEVFANLSIEPPLRQDSMFMRKNGTLLFWHFFENMTLINNRVINFEALYRTLCLLAVEVCSDEVLVELLHMLLSIQTMAEEESLPITHKCAIHALVAAVMSILAFLSDYSALKDHIMQVIEARQNSAPYALPIMAFNRTNSAESYPPSCILQVGCLFNPGKISSLLEAKGYDVPSNITKVNRPATIDATDMAASHSISDIHSISDLESVMSSPRTSRPVSEDFTFEALKKSLECAILTRQEVEDERCRIYASFRTGNFDDIIARNEAKSTEFHNTLNDILDVVGRTEIEPVTSNQTSLHQLQFPKLYVY